MSESKEHKFVVAHRRDFPYGWSAAFSLNDEHPEDGGHLGQPGVAVLWGCLVDYIREGLKEQAASALLKDHPFFIPGKTASLVLELRVDGQKVTDPTVGEMVYSPFVPARAEAEIKRDMNPETCEHHWHVQRGMIRFTAPVQRPVQCCHCGKYAYATTETLSCGRQAHGPAVDAIELHPTYGFGESSSPPQPTNLEVEAARIFGRLKVALGTYMGDAVVASLVQDADQWLDPKNWDKEVQSE